MLTIDLVAMLWVLRRFGSETTVSVAASSGSAAVDSGGDTNLAWLISTPLVSLAYNHNIDEESITFDHYLDWAAGHISNAYLLRINLLLRPL